MGTGMSAPLNHSRLCHHKRPTYLLCKHLFCLLPRDPDHAVILLAHSLELLSQPGVIILLQLPVHLLNLCACSGYGLI